MPSSSSKERPSWQSTSMTAPGPRSTCCQTTASRSSLATVRIRLPACQMLWQPFRQLHRVRFLALWCTLCCGARTIVQGSALWLTSMLPCATGYTSNLTCTAPFQHYGFAVPMASRSSIRAMECLQEVHVHIAMTVVPLRMYARVISQVSDSQGLSSAYTPESFQCTHVAQNHATWPHSCIYAKSMYVLR